MSEEKNFVTDEDNDDILNFGEEFDNKNFSLIDEGDYEVVLEKLDKMTSKKGDKYLNVRFGIRKDVDQKFKGRKLFYTIFAQEGDKAYNFDVINKIIITQKGRPNYNTHFQTLDEVFQYLIGLHLVVSVEITFDNFSGEDKNRIKDWSFAPSAWDLQDHSKEDDDEPVEAEPVEAEPVKAAPKAAKVPEHVPSVQAQAPVNNEDPVDLPDDESDDLPF